MQRPSLALVPLLASLVASSALGANPCAKPATAFDVHGSGTKRGAVRYFRRGATFSSAGGEGGMTALVLLGLRRHKLRIRRVSRRSAASGRRRTRRKTLRYKANAAGNYRVVHVGTTVAFADKVVVQRGLYAIRRVRRHCFRVTLMADIPAYEGE